MRRRCWPWSPLAAPIEQIAAALVISHKTVARHLSNIFIKCGLTSRAAATAYAFDHHLLTSRRG